MNNKSYFCTTSKRLFHHISSSLKHWLMRESKKDILRILWNLRTGNESHSEFLKLIFEKNPKVLIKIIPTVVITYKCPLLWAYKRFQVRSVRHQTFFNIELDYIYICIVVVKIETSYYILVCSLTFTNLMTYAYLSNLYWHNDTWTSIW